MASVQLPAAELKKFTSITSVQTRGVRNFAKIAEERVRTVDEAENDGEQKRWSSIAGKTRKQRLTLLHM